MLSISSDSLCFVSLWGFNFFNLKQEIPRESIALDWATSHMYLYLSSINLWNKKLKTSL